MRRALAALLALAAWSGGAPAAGPTVYRCGPDGREYSQVPCQDGRVVNAADPRSSAQRREAKDVAESQARLARQLEDERRKRESATAPAAAFKPIPPQAAASAAKVQSKRSVKPAQPAADKDFVARVPAAPAGSKP